MALAFYIALIPHHSYPYPVHVDEWVHFAYSKAILTAGSTTFVDPFLGKSTIGFSTNLEAGFHVFWAVFHQISGISWLAIFRYFPAVIFMLSVLSVYVLARRHGFGLEAALFTSLIPTTVGILGPAFLVPVAMGLAFVSLSIFIAFNFSSLWSYLTLLVLTSFLLAIHAPSAIILVIILIPYILLYLKSNFRHSLGLTVAVAVPFLLPFPWIFDLLLPTAKALLVPQPLPTSVDFPRIIAILGYLPIGLCLLGVVILVLRGGRKDYGLVLGLLAILLMLAVFYTLHYGVVIVYTRGLMFMMLMVSIVSGAGLKWLESIMIPEGFVGRLRVPLVRQNIGKVLVLVLVGLTLIIAILARQSTPYYLMIDQQDYEAFVWINDNVSDDYDRAILDPWKATAFTAMTGKKVYTRIHAYPMPSDNEAYAFLRGGGRDTTFLQENDISIIYSRSSVDNPDLVEVTENVYLLKEAK